MREKIVCAMLGLSLSACAAGDKTMHKENPFTPQAELVKIEAAPAPQVSFKEPPLLVEEWTLTGPLATQLGVIPRTPQDEWERLVAAQAGKHSGMTFSEGGSCVAREVALFFMAKEAWPADVLDEFILSRCGSPGYTVATQTLVWEKRRADEIPIEQVADELRKALPGLVDQLKDVGANTEAGLWIGQDDKRLMIAVSVIPRRIDFKPVPLRVMDGNLVLEGKLLGLNGDQLQGYYTEGDYSAGTCVTDTRLALPSFKITCPLSVADPEVGVELGLGFKDRIAATSIAQRVFWPGAEPPNTWRSVKVRQILTATPPQPGGAPEQILEQLNLVRQAAGLAPHTLSATQTLTAGKLAPHLFAAMTDGSDPTTEDKILMGLLAGWDVQGQIVSGTFASQWSGYADISQLIIEMLERPAVRQALLGKAPGIISVGSVVSDGRVGAIVNIYNLLPSEDHARRLARTQQTINRARKVESRPGMVRDNNMDAEAARLSERVSKGEMTLEEAGNALATSCVSAWNQGVSGITFDTQDLDAFNLPAALLAASKLNAAIMVTSYRPKGYPWMVYGVVLIYPSSQVKR